MWVVGLRYELGNNVCSRRSGQTYDIRSRWPGITIFANMHTDGNRSVCCVVWLGLGQDVFLWRVEGKLFWSRPTAYSPPKLVFFEWLNLVTTLSLQRLRVSWFHKISGSVYTRSTPVPVGDCIMVEHGMFLSERGTSRRLEYPRTAPVY